MVQHIDETALFDIGYGMYVVTSEKEGSYNGLVVNTIVQVTAQPPRIAVIVHKENLTHDYIADSGKFAVSVLEQDTPMPYIGLFGFKSGRDNDKFSQVKYEVGETGCPILSEHTLSAIETKVCKKLDVTSHTLFVADVINAQVVKEGTPLTYAHYRECKNGTSSKYAPTFVERKKNEFGESPLEETAQKYVCTVCDYVYDPSLGDPENGIVAGTAFKDLPADWVCPICGVGTDEFEPA